MPGDTFVATFYHFVPVRDLEEWRQRLLRRTHELDLRGTILIASEGINVLLSGAPDNVRTLVAELADAFGVPETAIRYSWADGPVTARMKVRLRREIVSFDMPDFSPAGCAGIYVDPEDWNDLITQPDVVVVDTRNDYEYAIGTFEGAINPRTDTFRQLSEFVDRELSGKQKQRIAMFCTGGVRCEKSTAWLRERGFDPVYHLRGGILAYLERIPESESLWRGECFVFDDRVSVVHGLRPGTSVLCRACGRPVTAAAQRDARYEPEVSCPACYDRTSEADKARFRQRREQLARAAG